MKIWKCLSEEASEVYPQQSQDKRCAYLIPIKGYY